MLCWLLLLVCRDYGAPGSVVPPEQVFSFHATHWTGPGGGVGWERLQTGRER